MEQKLEFINTKSHITKVNPSLKILYLILYIVICCLSLNYNYILIANFILVTYLLLSSKIPLRFYLKNIFKVFLFIVALYIILASFSYSLLFSTLVVLSFIFGVCLYSMIIYTTHPFDLTLGIWEIIKHFNILSLNETNIFIRIYNFVYLRYDFNISVNNVIDSLELKGVNVRHKNIIARFLIKANYLNDIFEQIKIIRNKRTHTIKRNKFNVGYIKSKVNLIDVIYLGLFILLIVLYISKVI